MALAAGVNTRLLISAAAISSPSLTALPLSVKVPAAGRVAMVMWSRLSLSTSAKLNSLAANVCVASSAIVTVLIAAVGASFTGVTSTVIV